MASSLSPDQESGPDQGPLSSLNPDLLKTLADKKTTQKGNPPKRRGPKPDSKPAMTRRQELNRQAQRTHRERKEHYIRSLEDEVLRLREVFTSVTQDKERLAEENQQLKAAMFSNSRSPPVPPSLLQSGPGIFDDATSNGDYTTTSMGSSNNYPQAPPSSGPSVYTTPPPSMPVAMLNNGLLSEASHLSPNAILGHQQSQLDQVLAQKNPRLDYEQAGIDFVLTLEKPCMKHMPWLVERAKGTEWGTCGHALMATCPPQPLDRLTPDTPFGHIQSPESTSIGQSSGQSSEHQYPHQQTWQLDKSNLTILLNLSSKLDLDGEITPIMAWGMILGHPRLADLTLTDFQSIAEELASKIRCYGFGAVLQEFEVRDALESAFSTKYELLASAGSPRAITGGDIDQAMG